MWFFTFFKRLKKFSMRLFFFILFICFTPRFVVAQEVESNSKLNSLLKQLRHSESDTARANRYLDLADFYKYQNQDSTLYFVGLADSLSTIENNPVAVVKITLLRAGVFFLRGDYKNVIEVSQNGVIQIEGVEGFKKYRADLLRSIGIAYGASGNYGLSLKYFLETKNTYESIGANNEALISLNNIGVIHLKLENYQEALSIFLELDDIVKTKTSNDVTIPVNLGFIYFELDSLNKAEEQLLKALSFEGDIDIRAYGLSNFKLGEIYTKQGKYQDAISAFEASIKVFDTLNNELEKVQSLVGIGKVYFKLNDKNKARTFVQEGLNISEQLGGLPEKKASLETLYQIEKRSENFDLALLYHESFQRVSDSLENSEVNAEIGRLTAEYEFHQIEDKMLSKQREQELKNQAQINRQRFLLISILGILVFVFVVMFFMYKSNDQKKKTNALLSIKNNDIEDKATKLDESNKVKNRLFSIIAHDLKGPLSSLYAIITLIEMNVASQENLKNLLPEVDRRFKYTSTMLNNLLLWAQSQMEGYKVLPKNFDITHSFRENEAIMRNKLDEKNITFNLSQDKYIVFADKNMIGLVVQNLIANAIKYCNRNGNIEISISSKESKALICIKDDGIGIKKEAFKTLFQDTFYTTKGTSDEKGTGIGLMLCRDFVAKNGGEIWAKSIEGEGSSFYFTLPHP